MIDKRKQIIEVVPYNPIWPILFAEEAALIQPLFANNFSAIHHVGSTSVPGLSAKPTIDIILVVNNIELVDACNSQMRQLGYEAWGEYGIPGRRFFLKGETKRTHHVHTFQSGSLDIMRHIAVHEYLKVHLDEANAYSELKIKLAQQFAHNRRAYVVNKQEYVQALEKRAVVWFEDMKIDIK